MNKILFFILILFIGCQNQPDLLSKEFNKAVKKTSEILIKVEGATKRDTIKIVSKNYNLYNQITDSKEILFFEDTIQVKYIYDELNRIEKEIVYLSADKSEVLLNYFFQDSLLKSIIGESTENNFYYEQVEKFEHNDKNELEKSSLQKLSIDLENKDTLQYNIEKSTYDSNRKLIFSDYRDLINSNKDRKSKFKFVEDNLISIEEYNSNDVLISKITIDYELDNFNNWMVKNIYENNTLSYIVLRKIIYK